MIFRYLSIHCFQLLKFTPVCALSAAQLEEPSPFENFRPNCKPIASKLRHFCKEDQDFIQHEINKVLPEDIIEPSNSLWRVQVVVVVKDHLNRHKKRLCIDYSQTVNQYTELHTYPLPRIADMIDNIAG